ncbi:MAG: hypothetical protein J6Y98_10190 [Bacteroidales bacterium]|nr:hypothetical protein [Bacteroidales bacterium]
MNTESKSPEGATQTFVGICRPFRAQNVFFNSVGSRPRLSYTVPAGD